MKIDSALSVQFSFSGQAHLHSRRPLSGPSGASSFGIRFKLGYETYTGQDRTSPTGVGYFRHSHRTLLRLWECPIWLLWTFGTAWVLSWQPALFRVGCPAVASTRQPGSCSDLQPRLSRCVCDRFRILHFPVFPHCDGLVINDFGRLFLGRFSDKSTHAFGYDVNLTSRNIVLPNFFEIKIFVGQIVDDFIWVAVVMPNELISEIWEKYKRNYIGCTCTFEKYKSTFCTVQKYVYCTFFKKYVYQYNVLAAALIILHTTSVW